MRERSRASGIWPRESRRSRRKQRARYCRTLTWLGLRPRVLGDLGDRHVEQEAKGEHLALGLGQTLEEDRQVLAGEPGEGAQLRLDRLGGLLDDAARRWRRAPATGHLGRVHHLDPPLGPQVITGAVAGDDEEPGAEGLAALLVGADLFDQLHEDHLGQVLGLVLVLEQQPQVAVDALEVARVEDGEALPVALLDLDDEPSGVLVLECLSDELAHVGKPNLTVSASASH